MESKFVKGGSVFFLYRQDLKSVWRLSLVAAVLFSVLALINFNLQGAQAGNTKPLSEVTAFQHLELATFDDGVFTSEMLRQYDLIIVDLWETECFHCVDEMPAMAQFSNSLSTLFPKNKVLYLGICTNIIGDDDVVDQTILETAKRISNNANVHYPQLISNAAFFKEVICPYITGFPTIFYLDGDGNILHQTGGLTENGYLLQINSLLDAKKG